MTTLWMLLAALPLAGLPAERTVMVALQVDRDGVALVGTATRERAFQARPETARGPDVRLEIALLGADDRRLVQHRDVAGLCLDHAPDAEDHVAGDTIRLHRETIVVEVPEIEGFSRLRVGWLPDGEGLAPLPLGEVSLAEPGILALTPGTVHWPEEYDDRDVYTVFGSEAEVATRINVVLVPDGYTYAEKGVMLAHAQALVSFFRAKTPFREHDPFLNYVLVHAYSTESGTDQCDCGVVLDTAMRTRFPLQNPSCGHSDNRCLFYGTGNGGPSCDPVTSSVNIAAAELRAPAQDVTLVMVNTTRYGGCGGSRAVYSAGAGSAVEIAAHELGHSLAGLADEYAYTPGCGTSAGEVNTSANGLTGAWPEWIEDLGTPSQGAQYYQSCLFRPAGECDMRSLGYPFCPVCNQRWALRFFGHPRVSPTAPIGALHPDSPVATQVGLPVTFTAATRLGINGVENSFAWHLQGPGLPGPILVDAGGSSHGRTFAVPGTYTLTLEVIADTNFVKKERVGDNRDQVSWTIEAAPVPEVAGLLASRAGGNPERVDLRFQDTGATAYNLYVSREAGTAPFRVADPALGKRVCGLSAAPDGQGMVEARDVDLELPAASELLFFLVRADNGPGAEGPLGEGRTADAACAP